MAKKATPKKKHSPDVRKKVTKPELKILGEDVHHSLPMPNGNAPTKEVIIPLSQEKIIRDVYAKGLDDGEFEVFKMICRRTHLDPTRKQIVAVKRWDANLKREVMTPQTTIDGYRAIGNRSGTCAGVKTVFHYAPDGSVEGATTIIKKVLASGVVAEFEGYAKMSEYIPTEKMAFMYKQKPHVMIGKCSEALAWRRAYPEDMSGIYVEEELMMTDAPVAMVFDDVQVIEMLQKCENLEQYKVIQNDIVAMKYKISNMDQVRKVAVETMRKLIDARDGFREVASGKGVVVPVDTHVEFVDPKEPTEAEKQAIRDQEKREYEASLKK